jgi:hypothetical protein
MNLNTVNSKKIGAFMNIPNLPTDSLYKFIALSGLFILLLSVIYPLYRENELGQRLLTFEGEVEILNVDISFQLELAKNTKSHSFSLDDPDIPQILRFKEATAKLETQRKQITFLSSEIDRYKRFRWIGICLGMVMILSGFTLWYYRVQRFQDLLLYREAKKIEEESKKNL